MKRLTALLLVLAIGAAAYSHYDNNGDGFCDNCGTQLYRTSSYYVAPVYSAPVYSSPVYTYTTSVPEGYGSGYATGTYQTIPVRGRFGFYRNVNVDVGYMGTARQPVKMVRGLSPRVTWVRYADGSVVRHVKSWR